MSAACFPAAGVKLHERFTLTGPRSGRTLAATKSGPIAKSGFGLVARNTWARVGAGVTVTSSDARTIAAPSSRDAPNEGGGIRRILPGRALGRLLALAASATVGLRCRSRQRLES